MPVVAEKRMRDLLAKERAHDDYLAAAREVRERRAKAERSGKPPEFLNGYSQCQQDWARAIVNATNRPDR